MDPTVNFYYYTGSSMQLLQRLMTKEEVGLVLGNKQTGKTTTALQAIREARSHGLIAHYVSLQHLRVILQILSKVLCGLVALSLRSSFLYSLDACI